ncbi:putative tricarboxylic transport membrane protein [Clavibacter sp. B3I6]|uniref:tripartite tricarboxylate transporter permease n=1 Tax=Clavibacter sp. B3I6 TaxID=3042268 RepID=UPI002781589D|nr:tripartite tricarboxylate transporter permease [Clavibacter sp. B3I6]MDQ0744137.1 putative tricarboxylic transport membrane protein [Clavibacter sp. B3I6]
MLDNLALGFSTAFTPENLLWCFIGVLLGTVIGLMPGLGSTTGVAILIPLTLTLEPVTALIMLAGIYYGAQYGGTITSVLISTPGEAASVVTTLDGYQMAKNGKAGSALAISAIGSFVAAIISLALLMWLAPPLADLALNFGPVENLAIMILGLVIVVSFAGGSLSRGLMMAAVGLLISTVGVATGFSSARFTFGNINLLGGIPFIEVMIGLFAVGEVLHQIRQGADAPIRTRFKDMVISRAELKRSAGPILRGSGIGFVLGILPGAGSTLASFMAYGIEKRVSPRKAMFGKGAIEGVAAPESANNAAANANFVPTLALGIPGGGTTAVLLGAFTVYGLQPGPRLFETQPTLIWGLLVSFFIGNVMLLVLNLPLAPVFAQMLRIPYGYLYPIILLTSFVGAYSVSNNMFSVLLVLIFGIVGWLMKELDLPMAPLVLGLVLGPLFEKSLVQTSALGQGNFGIMLEHPISVGILIFTVALMVVPKLATRFAVRRRPAVVPEREKEGV